MGALARVAVVNDAHGNLDALQAVLAEIDRIAADVVVVGGDAALGPLPSETLELLRSRPEARFLRGNCDRDLAAAPPPAPPASVWAERLEWSRARLSAEQRAFLGALPITLSLDVEGLGPTLFCHGSPRDDDEIITCLTPAARLEAMLAGARERVIVGGHTHVQYDREIPGRRIVNAGSVGMAYEGRPCACWAMLGPDVRLIQTPYDFDRAAARFREVGYPGTEEFIEQTLRHPEDGAKASALFERMAGERMAPRRQEPA